MAVEEGGERRVLRCEADAEDESGDRAAGEVGQRELAVGEALVGFARREGYARSAQKQASAAAAAVTARRLDEVDEEQLQGAWARRVGGDEAGLA